MNLTSKALSEDEAKVAESVPGQLFRDVVRFHKKFGLAPTTNEGHNLDLDKLKFRIKFLYEELEEYCKAVGVLEPLDVNSRSNVSITRQMDAEEAFDGLIDLVVVALGTAYLHGFDFNRGWDRVMAANMQKVRVERAEDSKRGSTFDVRKPEGWQKPVLKDLL